MQVNEHANPRLHRKSNSINLSVKDTQRDSGWEKGGREETVGLAISAQKRKGNRVNP